MSLSLLRPFVRQMEEYRVQRPSSKEGWQMQDFNENILLDGDLWRYPLKQPPGLQLALANLYGVEEKNLLLGRGSDELIDCLIRSFCEPSQDSILQFTPTFSFYENAAGLLGVGVDSLRLNSSMQLPLEEFSSAFEDLQPKLVFVCSPNNPTGNTMKKKDVEALLDLIQGRALLVLDEAYIEYSEQDSFVQQALKDKRLVVLRTMSKIYGLAALRLGALIAHHSIIKEVSKVLAPYPIAEPLEKLAIEAIQKLKLFELKSVVVEERKKLEEFFRLSPKVAKVYPSDANFLLVSFHNLEETKRALSDAKIAVRDRSYFPGLKNCLRFTVGRPEQNLKLREVLS